MSAIQYSIKQKKNIYYTVNTFQSQQKIHINGQFRAFFKSFRIGTLNDRAGIRKQRRYHVCLFRYGKLGPLSKVRVH